MAATRTVGLKGRGRSTSSMQGRKAKLSQHARELRTIIAWQGAAPWASRGRAGAGGGLSGPPIVLCGTNSTFVCSRAREEGFHVVLRGRALQSFNTAWFWIIY